MSFTALVKYNSLRYLSPPSIHPMKFPKLIGAICALGTALFASPAFAQTPASSGLFDSISLEYGANSDQQLARVALQSDWKRRWRAKNGRHIGGYWDTNVAAWRLKAYENIPGQHKTIGVIGLTPVVRYQNDSGLGWYVEAGVGVTLLSTLYKNRDKEMSTAFQFADHVGVGYLTPRWDIGLKLQHYSNASIKSPNAGANWLVLRAAYKF